MKHARIALILASALMLSAASSFAADTAATSERFAKKDKDGDGKLSKTEAKGWWIVSKNFDAMDTDSDGTVSLAEINIYMSAQKSQSASAK